MNLFYQRKRHYKKVLLKIVAKMMDDCRYTNGYSLDQHDWGDEPKKLKGIPKDKDSPDFEKRLLEAISKNEIEGIDKYINEICWGDVQSGKTTHACIIMWFSVFILRRPVLYIFRNFGIDKDNLKDDIRLEGEYSFNVNYIKKIFYEINKELIEKYDISEIDSFKLPKFKDIGTGDMMDELSKKSNMRPDDIYCCLMNDTQLEKIDKEFSKYIADCEELVNITLLVDEADLTTPTARNDKIATSKNESNTACERLLSTIYKKVKYSLKITGTAHGLLSNYTTKLSDNEFVEIKPSRVHVMKTGENYYGILNEKINIKTEEEITENGKTIKRPIVTEFWKKDKKNKKDKKEKYSLSKNYNLNIKKILNIINDRDLSASPNLYNSVLISEDKYKENQFNLVHKIINDYKKIFVILFHGDCLRLYLSKEYLDEILFLSQRETRLFSLKGIHGSSIDSENGEILPNNYCYFDINVKKQKNIKVFTIKQVYKLLAMLFVESRIPIQCKTLVTISGKYADRGYSFTSDDYGKYIFHLTDQIYFSHSSIICTILAQSLRLQVKTNDENLKNGLSQLTLWTTKECEEAIEFYVKFSNLLKSEIGDCKNNEEIIQLLEKYIFHNIEEFQSYFGLLVSKRFAHNWDAHKLYEKKYDALCLKGVKGWSDQKITEWIREQNAKCSEDDKFPDYICVNEIKKNRPKKELIEKHGILVPVYDEKPPQPYKENKLQKTSKIFDSEKDYLEFANYHKLNNRLNLNNDGFYTTTVTGSSKVYQIDELKSEIKDFKNGVNLGFTKRDGKDTTRSRLYIGYEDTTNPDTARFILRISTITDMKPTIPPETTDIKKTPYILYDDKVDYSVLKDEYTDNLPNKYYFITPSGWLYLKDSDKNKSVSIDIIKTDKDTSPVVPEENTIIQSTINIQIEPIINSNINSNIQLFINTCCQPPTPSNLRMGITEIYNIYKEWSLKNSKDFVKQTLFKTEIERAGIKDDERKGVDINNKPGKRGYNIMVKI